MIGVAFSIGFVFGPLIGAIFSRWAREQQDQFYVYPALFALVLAAADVLYIIAVFKETLPLKKRVSIHTFFNFMKVNRNADRNASLDRLLKLLEKYSFLFFLHNNRRF